ncbi:phosphatase domain-containing putative toxin [Candidatus Protochlamydia sp. R18]|uniref:phosphatase domain-containing putative toxin n=1 Tax=Candidatus Protochlamydia sp. R18 TaxID=1353977 RepID=UPI000694CB90|nr:hypothetical protein [Candidatus Protochlamydia sp. R18]
MKNIYILLFLFSLGVVAQSFLYQHQPTLFPIVDAPLNSENHLPKKWRSTKQISQLVGNYANLKGLTQLHLSGSGQFSQEDLENMSREIKGKAFVLDLREESHGFIDGTPISWTDGLNYGNVGKTLRQIELDEQKRLKLTAQKGSIIVDLSKDLGENFQKFFVREVKTEKELVESFGYTYIRLPITDHHRPVDSVVDQFIEIVLSLPADSWIHLHCKGGKGRTTTFMTLYDIMHNAQTVGLNDILSRQTLLGGADLVQAEKNETYKQKPAKDRIEFIRAFYTYCREVPNFEMTWSDWVHQKQLVAYQTSSSN